MRPRDAPDGSTTSPTADERAGGLTCFPRQNQADRRVHLGDAPYDSIRERRAAVRTHRAAGIRPKISRADGSGIAAGGARPGGVRMKARVHDPRGGVAEPVHEDIPAIVDIVRVKAAGELLEGARRHQLVDRGGDARVHVEQPRSLAVRNQDLVRLAQMEYPAGPGRPGMIRVRRTSIGRRGTSRRSRPSSPSRDRCIACPAGSYR